MKSCQIFCGLSALSCQGICPVVYSGASSRCDSWVFSGYAKLRGASGISSRQSPDGCRDVASIEVLVSYEGCLQELCHRKQLPKCCQRSKCLSITGIHKFSNLVPSRLCGRRQSGGRVRGHRGNDESLRRTAWRMLRDVGGHRHDDGVDRHRASVARRVRGFTHDVRALHALESVSKLALILGWSVKGVHGTV